MSGWPIFSEWEERKKLPYYGGNKIPVSYLAKFLDKSKEQDDLPANISNFVEQL